MSEHQVLFCPFCRESYEGAKVCPDHDLALVPWGRLAPAPHEQDPDDLHDHETLRIWELGAGRGLVAAAALLNAGALSGALGSAQDPPLGSHPALSFGAAFPVLWTLPLVSFTLLFVLGRRRTRAALRSMRLLVPLLGLPSLAALCVVDHRLGRPVGTLFLGLRGGGPGTAVCAVLAASLLMLIGGLRLGGRQDPAAH
jgi:hypothetical protein